jgi:hypothetical protein
MPDPCEEKVESGQGGEIDEGELPEAGEEAEIDDGPQAEAVETNKSALSSLAELTKSYCDYKRKDWAPSTMMVTDGQQEQDMNRDREEHQDQDKDRDRGRERERDRRERSTDAGTYRDSSGDRQGGDGGGSRGGGGHAGDGDEGNVSLLVRNLSFNTTVADLKYDFEKFG